MGNVIKKFMAIVKAKMGIVADPLFAREHATMTKNALQRTQNKDEWTKEIYGVVGKDGTMDVHNIPADGFQAVSHLEVSKVRAAMKLFPSTGKLMVFNVASNGATKKADISEQTEKRHAKIQPKKAQKKNAKKLKLKLPAKAKK